jgi:hypothetical protein
MTEQTASALPPVVDRQTWQAALDDLRVREKAATRELDAIAAQRRRLPMVELPDHTLIGPDGPVRLVDVFDGRSHALIDILPWGRQEEWQDSPDGWPKSPAYSKWLDSPDVARLYGPK